MKSIFKIQIALALGLLLSAFTACEKVKGSEKAPSKTEQVQDKKKAGDVAITDMKTIPKVSPKDKKFANVFKLLDGTWKGEFKIYVHESGQTDAGRPKKLTPEAWTKPPYKLQSKLNVMQVYKSESPYFQRVKVTDIYADGRKVVAHGVNKVQDGKLYCVVKKPDDMVVHDGITEGKDTIIWSRNRAKPQSIEYFREKVTKSEYTIHGWGYYGGADPKKSPTHYFSAVYKRVK